MLTIGLSSCGKDLTENLFENYKKAGILMMELSVAEEKFDEIDYEAVHTYATRHGITLWSCHLPAGLVSGIDLSDDTLTDRILPYYKAIMQKASAIGIHTFVVHPSVEPIEESDRPRRIACAKRTLAALADIAATYDGVIAVENLPRTCLGRDTAEMEELQSAHPALRVCFDTNHLLTDDPVTFIRRLGDKIVTTHVSDYDFIDEQHWLPGEGKIDWPALLQALCEVGYHGPWLYELGFKSSGSILRNRDLTCEDFARNAGEIFEGKPITVLGREFSLL